MINRYSRWPALLLLALLLPVLPLSGWRTVSHAQHNATETYAITNARVVTVSGPVIDRGTVVIRNGLIAAVGADVTAPADARVIDSAGLTVYPGLIDANTSLGMPQPSATPAPGGRGGGGGGQFGFPATQPPMASPVNSTQPAGLQPEILAEDFVRPGADIESARNAGITTALTAPRSGIFAGQSALINLAGETPQEMIVRSPVALHIGFTPLRNGGYPGSLMGVFSAIRQMFLDAQRYEEAQKVYARSPRGVRRPDRDKSLEALLLVLHRELPVVMHADREREIVRALDLAQEFKLRAIIAGGEEAWKVADRLRDAQVPVLLSLDFPRRTTAAAPPEADPEPLRILRERVEAPKCAGRLAAAHVRFAFESGGLTNLDDFRANAAKAVEGGLTKDEAVKAMTIGSAEILGAADRLGSIEVGKIANLTITRGDLLDRNTRIAYVFIDGRQMDARPTPARPADSGNQSGTPAEESQASVSGTWSLNITFGGQGLPGTLVLRQQGSTLSGSLQTEIGTSEFNNGTINGDAIHATTTANIQGQQVDLTLDGTASGNEIHGTIKTQLGDATFTGTKTP
jgi:imidazolonepropionase-like amidohydrolase